MGLIKEFQEFALKGNVVDMAVGIIIGGAFGKIVTSMVNDIIMPLVGSLTGGGSLGSRFTYLGTSDEVPQTIEAAKQLGEPYIAWGPFAQTTLDFLIIALTIFVAIKLMNNIRKRFEQEEEEQKAAEPSAEVKLLTEIRDALANK